MTSKIILRDPKEVGRPCLKNVSMKGGKHHIFLPVPLLWSFSPPQDKGTPSLYRTPRRLVLSPCMSSSMFGSHYEIFSQKKTSRRR